MEVRTIRPAEFEEARQLLLAAGWERRVSTQEEFAELVSRSQIALVAIQESLVVGFLRALTDGLANGYISMVVVHERYRGCGIGRLLVEAVLGKDTRITWVLRASRADGVAKFYEKLGFSHSEVAMERAGVKRVDA